jgi:bifunctional non-homologous end joining protein LigD
LSRDPRLATYRAKRDPAGTPEPFGGAREGGGRFFMVHKHAARQLHYDLRLEMGGVLVSWAVPKGPSVRPSEKRLAVHVEDHPLEYGDFEGVIPEGNYGAGPSLVWDRGTYRLVDGADPLEAVRGGKLDLELSGFKMRGRWALVRTSRGERDWLLIKKADAAASDVELTGRFPESVLSGLTIEEMRDGSARLERLRAHLRALRAPRGEVTPGGEPFMLATLVEAPPAGRGWIYEIKYDGVRVLAARRGRALALYGRRGNRITARYPEIARALTALPLDDFVIDGEIVALDESGRPSFQLLQGRMGLTDPREIERAAGEVPVSAVFFDCLAADGHDLRTLPLAARKECLRLFVPPRGVAAYGDHVAEHGLEFHAAVCEQGLEGIMAKRADSVYTATRSRDWLKIKCQRRQEFVVGGYTQPQGTRACFGALHLGVYDRGRLVYVGKVGTGFDQAALTTIHAQLEFLRRPTSPFEVGSPAGRAHRWVEPRLVAEVRFTEWTRDGGIRHPAFLGLRPDKDPRAVAREAPAAPPAPPTSPAPRRTADAPRVRLTNLTKVFWPREDYTKGDLIAYYDAVAPLLLPYLRDRPLVLTRYPDGIEGKSFYQKDAPPFVPDWIRTERIPSDDRDIRYLVVESADALRYVINLGAIPLHLWASRVAALDRPDWLVLDLDPKGAPFAHVVRIARLLHDLLDNLALPNYVKTSGATGLHILVPLGARYAYTEARGFAHLLAMLAVQEAGDIATVTRAIRSRDGKVYVDWGQNARGQTIAGPFSARPLPGAPVSCPLEWGEVTAKLDPARFTITTVPERFAGRPDSLAPVLAGGIDIVAAVAAIERRLTPSVASAGTARRPRRRR